MQENIEIILVNSLLVVLIIILVIVSFYLVRLIKKLTVLIDEATESIENVNDVSERFSNDYDIARKNLHTTDNLIKMINLGIKVFESKKFQQKMSKLVKKVKA